MHTPLVLLVSALLGLSGVAACGAGEAGDASAGDGDAGATFDDPEVARIHQRMMQEMAPDDGWGRTRYIAFDWIVDRGEGEPTRRSHQWDVWEGRYRLETPSDGGRTVAYFDVDHPTEGERIYVDGELVEDSARSDELARQANSRFINDSYWLLMPYKWGDPGVNAEYLGTREMWDDEYEVVELTFDSVGLTPQNKYRAFVNPETGMMELWQHYRNASDSTPSFTLEWADWQRHGPIRLAAARPDREGFSRIRFENLRADTVVPEGVFEPPPG